MASTMKSFTGIYSIPPDEETLPKSGKGQLSPSPWILEVPCKTLLIPPCDRNQIITASGTSLKWGSPVRTLEDLLLAVARTKASARPKSCLRFFSSACTSPASVASPGVIVCKVELLSTAVIATLWSRFVLRDLLTSSASVTAEVSIVFAGFSIWSLTLAPLGLPSRYSIQASASTTYLVVVFHLILDGEGSDSPSRSEEAFPGFTNLYIDKLSGLDSLFLGDLSGDCYYEASADFSDSRQGQ